MKKIVSLLISVIFVFAVCITADAEGIAELNGNTSVSVGSNIEFTVTVNGCTEASSVAVSAAFGDGFELVSGSWLKSGAINTFDKAKNKGSLGGLSSPDINGNLFKLVLRAKTASVNMQNVSVNVIAKKDAAETLNYTASKSVKINCASHTFSAYTNINSANHSRTCSVCGTVETNAHTWNGGETIKTATCKETGEKRFTCTACNATKTEVVAKTNNHTYSAWTQTKAPTCTDKGSESRTCSTCRNTETREIAASGHKFGKWTETKAATCTDKGAKERKCSKCDTVEKDEINPLGHDFKSPVIIKKPTLTEKGIEEGICKRCGEKAQSELPCFFKDEATDVVLSPEYGAFKQGTEIKIEVIKNDNSFYETVKTALGDKSEEFIAYDISAVLNNVNIEPDKPVTVTFKIPDGYGKNVAVFYIKDESDAEKLESTVSEDGSTVSVTLTHFSSYAVAKLSEKASPSATAKTEKSTDEKPETTKNSVKRNKAIGTIILITVIILLIATAVILYLKKRKSKNQYNEYDLIN